MTEPWSPWRARMPSWRGIWNHLWQEQPLRQKLALGVWLSVVPVTLAASLVALGHAQQMVKARVREEMMRDASQASNWFDNWRQSQIKIMTYMAGLPAIRSLEPQQVLPLLQQAHAVVPAQTFALHDRDGALVAISQGQARRTLTGRNAGEAMAGISSTHVITPRPPGTACFATSVPIYSNKQPRNPPIGVLSSCIPLLDLSSATGLNSMMMAEHGADPNIPRMNLFKNRTRGYAILQVHKPGWALLLDRAHYSEEDRKRLIDPRQSLNSPWAPFIKLALSSHKDQEFSEVTANGISYYVAIDRTARHEKFLVVLDKKTAYEIVNTLFNWALIGDLAGLLITSLAIYRICGTLTKPIDQAGEALSRISHGDFSQHLPDANSDMGRLFGYINSASERLRCYLAESNAHAITDAQLKEARHIQAHFLIRQLPTTPWVDLAADFDPAYEIGADWYDALEINGVTVVVVADVCDKGIPSALYMSVFRSLLRLSLRNEWEQYSDPGVALCQALTAVNLYMAETHSDTAMFATAFVGAYDPQRQQLSYVVAGHELPLLVEGQRITSLELGGPALGLFPEAHFQHGQCPMGPGSLLLAFSDGLPDARNPANESFGHDRVVALLQNLMATDPSAGEVVAAMRQAVLAHMAEAEQFDDLTLLALKAKSGA